MEKNKGTNTAALPPRMCPRCRNHDPTEPKAIKGHKYKCPYKDCSCAMCALIVKRRHLDRQKAALMGKKSVWAETKPSGNLKNSVTSISEISIHYI